MRRLLLLTLIVVFGCNKPAEQSSTTAAAPATAAPTQSAPADAPASEPPQPAPATASSAAPAGGIATQETNWKGVSMTVTEFRRKGNTLTAKVQLVDHGTSEAHVETKFDETYLIDTAAGKKFNVLKDEKGAYIASLRSGWNDRWYDTLKPGESYLLWMKFPAPPAETKAITLQLPGAPPFEDLPIQD